MAEVKVAAEAANMCQDVIRVSGGGMETTFGDLCQDEIVEQRYEALLGTLKAARKRGFLTFDGELLLMGQHNDTAIALTEAGAQVAAGGAADAQAAAGEEAAVAVADMPAEPEDVAEELCAEPSAAGLAVPVEEAALPEAVPAADKGAAAEQLEVPAAPVEGDKVEEAAPLPAAQSATTAASPLEERTASPTGAQGAGTSEDDGSRKWKVDTGYIDYRTADPDRLEGRRGQQPEKENLPSGGAANAQKDKDGKWTAVDVSYINHRSAMVDNLKIASGEAATAPAGVTPSNISATTKKESDGKWKVDTSYINARTADVENLEHKLEAKATVSSDTSAPSSTVKKDAEGKWKVDMGYINYRTGDTENLTKNVQETQENQYADPSGKKYSYDLLKGISNRPDDVDPKCKELYLSEEDFESVFEIAPAAYQKMPKWKQQNLKKAKDVF